MGIKKIVNGLNVCWFKEDYIKVNKIVFQIYLKVYFLR